MGEDFAAGVTLEGGLAAVKTFVRRKCGREGEALVAYFTTVRFLARVNPQMTLEADFLGKLFVAHSTPERIKLGVPPLVGVVRVQQDKTLLAQFALVRPFPVMSRRFMSLNERLTDEAFAANFTPMFAAGQMQLPVRGQRAGVRERFVTAVTLVGALAGVLDVVSHQIQLAGVALATLGAFEGTGCFRRRIIRRIVFRVATVGGALGGC